MHHQQMPDEHQHPDEPPYDAEDDIAKSVLVAFEAVRRRMAAGGPGWTPGAALDRLAKDARELRLTSE